MSLLIDELSAGVSGDPWHGDSVAALLKNVDADLARRRPIDGAHSIWEIVRHMTAWTQEVRRRLSGHPPGEPQIGDWPKPTGDDEAAWHADVQTYFDAHATLVEAVQAMTPDALSTPPADPRHRGFGSGVTYEVMLHGLAQHHAYHGGQIGLLKKSTRV